MVYQRKWWFLAIETWKRLETFTSWKKRALKSQTKKNLTKAWSCGVLSSFRNLWELLSGSGYKHINKWKVTTTNIMKQVWDLKIFEGQGLRARLCCRKISDSIFWLYYFTPRWLAGAMPCPKKVPKEIYRKKR